MLQALVSGYLVSLGLIMAIGAQNAFVLRQGLRREHVGLVVATCAISDALLIAVGIMGFGVLLPSFPMLGKLLLWASIGFLLAYGALRFRAAWRGGEALVPATGASPPALRVFATCLVFTWANPHVYLDTVFLIGSISAQYAPHKLSFGLGAAAASLSFFISLGFGARLLGPIFSRPRAWVILELVIGCGMWAIAIALALKN